MLRVYPEIRFHCSQCEQKIAVEGSAAGEMIDCPCCGAALVIPAAAIRLDGVDEPSERLRSNVSQRVRAQRRPLDTDRFCAEFLEATLSTNLLEEELAEAEQEIAALRQRLVAPKPEPMRHEREIQQLQSECRQADEERRLLQTQLITAQQQLAAAETQLLLRERAQEELRAELAGAEALGAEANFEMLRLRDEVAALRADLAGERVAAREALALAQALAETQAHLAETFAALKKAETSRDASAATSKRLRAKVAALQHDLHASTQPREYLKLRAATQRAEADRARMAVALAEAEEEMHRMAAREQARCAEVERLRREKREADRRAEAATETEGRVHRANEVLRGIIARQKSELEARYRELVRFRRSRVGLRLLRVVFAISIAGVIALALKVLPAMAAGF